MKQEPGFVYVVRMEGSEYFKVGRSVDVPKRMSEFGILLPFPYDLAFTHRVPNARHAEGLLHKEFDPKRIHGEWFLLNQNDLEHARAWLMYLQSHWLIERVVQKLYDETFLEGNVGFPWLYRFYNLLYRLERRDKRRLDHLIKFGRKPQSNPIVETEVVS